MDLTRYLEIFALFAVQVAFLFFVLRRLWKSV